LDALIFESMRLVLGIFLFFLTDFQASAKSPYSTFEESGKVGLKNQQGEILIPPQYEALGWSDGELIAVESVIGYKLNGLWGLISLQNNRITPPTYFTLSRGNHDLIIATKRNHLTFRFTSGCINSSGKEIIPFDYTSIKIIDLRAVVFTLDNQQYRYGLIDLSNKILIPTQFRSITPIGSLRFAVENFDRKIALFNDSGKPITSFNIDSISRFQNNHAVIFQNGIQGLINRDGIIVESPKYQEIVFRGNEIAARLPNEWRILDASNNLYQTIYADSLIQVHRDLFKTVKGSVHQLVNKSFEPVIPQPYKLIDYYRGNRALVKGHNQFGVIDSNGKEILSCEFDIIRILDNHILCMQSRNGKLKWMLYDWNGVRKSEKDYSAILPNHHGLFPVMKNNFWGAIDYNGKELIACVYDTLMDISQRQLAVKFKGQYGIIDRKEEWLVTPQPYPVQLLNDQRYFLKTSDMMFLKSFTNYTYYFTNNPILVQGEYLIERTSYGATWTINFDGQIVKREQPHYEPVQKIYESSEGLRAILKDGRYGFIDDRGRLRIANRYEGVKPFSDGLAAIQIRNKWGFINHDEQIVIQPTFDEVWPFQKGYSLVKQNEQFGLINKEGTLVLQARYDAITILETGRFLLQIDKALGLADELGNIILHPKYESITDLNNGYLIVAQHGKKGLLSITGLSTIPTQCDDLKYDQTNNRYLAVKKSEWTMLQKK
jgi:hypothetical protein